MNETCPPFSNLEKQKMTVPAFQPDQKADTLSATDDSLVQEFEKKLQVIRDRVGSAAFGYKTGICLAGRPGTSKTFTVKQELERLEEQNLYRNARMNAWGLFSLLADHPEHLIVLDDITSLFSSKQAMQIFLAALDGTPGKPRPVSYRTKDTEETIQFSGSIIAISNLPLRSDPHARALGSRIVVLEHEPSDDEISAFMRLLASKGFEDLSPDECMEVAEFIIAETRAHDQRLDLRHLTKACQDYRQCKHGRAKTSWQDLVRTSLRKLINESVIPMKKSEDMDDQRQLVRELMERFPNDRKRQLAEWPHCKSSFYDRRKEIIAAEKAA